MRTVMVRIGAESALRGGVGCAEVAGLLQLLAQALRERLRIAQLQELVYALLFAVQVRVPPREDGTQLRQVADNPAAVRVVDRPLPWHGLALRSPDRSPLAGCRRRAWLRGRC